MTGSTAEINIAVIGAGLAGLATALRLHEAGRKVHIVEARPRVGGRIHSVRDPATGLILGDLGPTWVWPAYQPVVQQWMDRLGLDVFEQFEQGHAVVDAGPGQPIQTGLAPGQHDIARVRGYSQALISALHDRLPTDAISLNAPATRVEIDEHGISLDIDGSRFRASRVICAVPPRVALSTVSWEPELPKALVQALAGSPTWMAPHAKAVAIFDRPVWREQGLSGRILGHAGPLMEAHDHSGPNGTPAAIFGFLGWPHQMRLEHKDRLPDLVADQLERCFGERPTKIWIEDWARDPYTAAPEDLNGPMDHPSVRPEVLRTPHFEGRLMFAGAETATQSPGLIEGAFVSADHTADLILKQTA